MPVELERSKTINLEGLKPEVVAAWGLADREFLTHQLQTLIEANQNSAELARAMEEVMKKVSNKGIVCC